MEDAAPISEHRQADEIAFDAITLMERCLQTVGELRNADLSKTEFMIVMGLFSRPLTRLLWEYYKAPEVD